MRRLALNSAITTLVILTLACATDFNKRSFETLGTMAVTYDTALKSAGDLYKRGLMTEESKNKIISVANAYQRTHNEAVDAFQQYLSSPPSEQDVKKRQYTIALQLSMKAYQELLNILYSNGIYGQPVEPWF